MPIVTIDPNEYTRFELKSAPADSNREGDEQGFIMVRPLPYGMKLGRDEKAMKLVSRTVKEEVKSGRMRKGAGSALAESLETELRTANEWASEFDFGYCIGDHNLLDNAGNKVDFTKKMSIKMLDPRVGSEIGAILFKINNEEDDETLEDFLGLPTTSSENGTELSHEDIPEALTMDHNE